METLKTAVLFPLRSEESELSAFSESYPFEFFLTPYLESSELRSSRGLNQGVNSTNIEEPLVPDSHLSIWAECNSVIAMDLPSNIPLLFPKLKWVQGVSAGHDHINSGELKEAGIALTTAKGIASDAIAEFVFSRLLQEVKHLRKLDAQQRERVWQAKFGNQLKGKTIGIVGVGSIGEEIANRAKAFGMRVLGSRKRLELSTPDSVDRLYSFSDINVLLGESDVVVMAAPSTIETRDLFDESKFSKMKRGSIFVNVARGIHVVEADLATYLSNGHLRAAILDVVRNEPLGVNSDLWTMPNLYLSPHCSVSFDDYERNAIDLFIRNAIRLLGGDELINKEF
ncbi:MAG: oxidoreductase [Acidimicrobiaceae bacterium]|nr:oxidoreductase [Acidimicrobiaceae bacterium]|tara:strand:+ start:672 stop:1691 length:1020 start_codon:yes stop_codon:yes gene_type:complete